MAIGTASHFKIPSVLRGRRGDEVVRPSSQITYGDGGGGGDTPNWVPANAKIYIDLVNNRAWTQTSGEVAITALVGSNPNYTFDPDLLVDGVGYTNGDDDTTIAVIGDALAAFIAGKIMVMLIIADNFGQFAADFYHSPGFNPDLTLDPQNGFIGNSNFTAIAPNSGAHKIALLSDGVSTATMSMDGAANVEDVGNISSSSNAFGIEWHGATLKTITLYDGTSADLQAVSA